MQRLFCCCVALIAIGAQALPDPTKPPDIQVQSASGPSGGEAAIQVSAIFLGNDSAYAIVNQRILHVGDEFNGMLVTAIDRRGISFQQQGIEKRVTFKHAAIIKDKFDGF
ncbi:hypothetical protein GCM10009092_42770 [Bowmanella denitrificans]|uniref:MSHA biogenesis protein MshK n=1 Tax=Bowmanella denitrificans TaxID=366582 RepID=A0ABN0XVP8_9ALTE